MVYVHEQNPLDLESLRRSVSFEVDLVYLSVNQPCPAQSFKKYN